MNAANTFSSWVLIERPILDVFDYVSDPHRLPEWVPIYTKVESEAEAHTRWKGPYTYDAFLGAPPWGTSETVTVVDVIPGRSLTFRGSSSVFGQTATYQFEPTSNGTVVTAFHSPATMEAFNAWIAVLRPWVEDALKQLLLHLKQRLENLRFRESPKRVFLCYRRNEDPYLSGRVCEALAREFGEDAIFRDIESLLPGAPYEKRMKAAIMECDAVVALIGRRWTKTFERKRVTSSSRAVHVPAMAGPAGEEDIAPHDGRSCPSCRLPCAPRGELASHDGFRVVSSPPSP